MVYSWFFWGCEWYRHIQCLGRGFGDTKHLLWPGDCHGWSSSKKDCLLNINSLQSWREASEWDRLSFSPLLEGFSASALVSASFHSLRSLLILHRICVLFIYVVLHPGDLLGSDKNVQKLWRRLEKDRKQIISSWFCKCSQSESESEYVTNENLETRWHIFLPFDSFWPWRKKKKMLSSTFCRKSRICFCKNSSDLILEAFPNSNYKKMYKLNQYIFSSKSTMFI